MGSPGADGSPGPLTILMAHAQVELYGGDRMFAEAVRALVDAGHRVVVTLPGPGPLADVVAASGAELAFRETPNLQKSALRPRGFARLLRVTATSFLPSLRLLRTVRPDVVYVSTVTAPLWTVLPRLIGRPVVVHVHEAEDTMPVPVQVLLYLPLTLARTVIVNSRRTAASVGAHLPTVRTRTRLIYNGVCGPESIAPVRSVLTPPIELVVIGRLSPRKGSDIAVLALAELRQRGRVARLTFVGDVFSGYEWFREDLQRLVQGHGLADHVRFVGFTDDVWPHLARADVALVPSRLEPFGNTAVEAQLAGVPVVVADVQGLPETVGHGEFGEIVATESPRALADGVEQLLDSWDDARDRAARALEHARTEFTPERYRADVAAVVAAAAGSRTRRPFLRVR